MTAYDIIREALYGNPPSPSHQPTREGVLAAFEVVLDSLAIAQDAADGTYIIRPTNEELDLFHNAGTYGRVIADPTPEQNGYWEKVGASGTGSWSFVGPDLGAIYAAEAAGYADETAADRVAVGAALALINIAVANAQAYRDQSEDYADASAASASNSSVSATNANTAKVAAEAARDIVLAIAGTAGIAKTFQTKADANGGIGGVANGAVSMVLVDESVGGHRTLYLKTAGVYGPAVDLTISRLTFLEFVPPYTNGEVMRINPVTSGLGKWHMYYTETLFDPGAYPDGVLTLGVNQTGGGGAENPALPAIWDQWEGYYDAGSTLYVERHLSAIISGIGQARFFSIRADVSVAGLWDLLFQGTTFSLRAKTPSAGLDDNPCFGVGAETFFFLPGRVSDEPTKGLAMAGGTDNFQFSAFGSGLDLLFANWSAIQYNSVRITPNGNIETVGQISSPQFVITGLMLIGGGVGASSVPLTVVGVDLIITAGGSEKLRFTNAGAITLNAPLGLKSYTVATLPSAPAAGSEAFVTDALTPAWNATVAGGGAVGVKVVYANGSWKVG